MWQRGHSFSWCDGKWVTSESLQNPQHFPPVEAGRLTEPLLFLLQLPLPPPQPRPPSTLISLALYQSPRRQLLGGSLRNQDQVTPTPNTSALHSEYQLLPAAVTSLHEVSLVYLEPCNPPGSSHLP